MLDKILPKEINNEFPGYKFSLYGFLIIIIITVTRSLAHIILPDGGAGSIATIDLNIEGADIIIGMFAQWGLSQLLMAVVYIVVFFRYKNLIPLMYMIFISEYIGRIVVGLLKPIETIGTAPGAVGIIPMILFGVIFLIFAILEPRRTDK